jgi:hypothetical protein
MTGAVGSEGIISVVDPPPGSVSTEVIIVRRLPVPDGSSVGELFGGGVIEGTSVGRAGELLEISEGPPLLIPDDTPGGFSISCREVG